MKKKHRNPNTKRYDYKRLEGVAYGMQVHVETEEYYGIHRDGGRAKIDIKRMQKIKYSNIPGEVLEAASRLPRNSVYFLPQKVHRADYVCNQFRDKLAELRAQWSETKDAFAKFLTPEEANQRTRLNYLLDGRMDSDEADAAGLIAGIKRSSTYEKLWISQCAQFIHQMATELDALMLRKCVYLGFAEKEVTRGKLHTYLNGTKKGRIKVDELNGYNVYAKFFMIWNMLKHNSEELFEKVQKNYPEMLLVNRYRNGEMSQYYLKIGNDYIEAMLSDLVPFYENLCREFFDEDPEQAKWNYDDYFTDKVKQTIEENMNPLGV